MIRTIKGYDVYVYKNGTTGFYGFVPGLNAKSRRLVEKTMGLESFIVIVGEQDSVVRFIAQERNMAVKLYPCQRPADAVGTGMHAFTGDPL